MKVCLLYRLLLIVQSSHRADEERTLVRGIAGLGKSPPLSRIFYYFGWALGPDPGKEGIFAWPGLVRSYFSNRIFRSWGRRSTADLGFRQMGPCSIQESCEITSSWQIDRSLEAMA